MLHCDHIGEVAILMEGLTNKVASITKGPY